MENPVEVAMELIMKMNGNHRAAEVEAWKLRDRHGRETAQGHLLAQAAFEIADQYHKVPWADETLRHAKVAR